MIALYSDLVDYVYKPLPIVHITQLYKIVTSFLDYKNFEITELSLQIISVFEQILFTISTFTVNPQSFSLYPNKKRKHAIKAFFLGDPSDRKSVV